MATLRTLIDEVRAEAGHAMSVNQGLNSVEALKRLIRKTEKELWTAFDWPELIVRYDIAVQENEVEYQYPADLQYEQIRHVFWAMKGAVRWHNVSFGIPEDGIMPYGAASPVQTGNTIQLWDTYYNTDAGENRLRIWPTPLAEGFLRIKGMKPLNCLIDDDDCCTLDPHLIVLLVSARLLKRAKADDAEDQEKAAQRHLQKLLANKISKKQKVSTMGANRHPATNRLTPYIDYIP